MAGPYVDQLPLFRGRGNQCRHHTLSILAKTVYRGEESPAMVVVRTPSLSLQGPRWTRVPVLTHAMWIWRRSLQGLSCWVREQYITMPHVLFFKALPSTLGAYG